MDLSSLSKTEKELKDKLKEIKKISELENLKIKYLGRKGIINSFFKKIKEIKKPEERKIFGSELNKLKKICQDLFEERKRELAEKKEEETLGKEIDISEPGEKIKRGHLHILSKTIEEMVNIFRNLGFEVVEGPEIETEYYNFDALNIPPNHPARDFWDTLWLEKKAYLLRTHTSPVQIRYLEKHNPPFRIIAPGRVFRYEATDASHDIQFYQLEGLMVDEKVSLANFKYTIEEFLNRFFSKKIEIRFRPSYFPFTEPSLEVDIKPENGKEFLEIMGAGMVHPQVLINAGYNPRNYLGFAFGLGIERLAMIKYKIPDIRLFYKNDLRFIRQF